MLKDSCFDFRFPVMEIKTSVPIFLGNDFWETIFDFPEKGRLYVKVP